MEDAANEESSSKSEAQRGANFFDVQQVGFDKPNDFEDSQDIRKLIDTEENLSSHARHLLGEDTLSNSGFPIQAVVSIPEKINVVNNYNAPNKFIPLNLKNKVIEQKFNGGAMSKVTVMNSKIIERQKSPAKNNTKF